MNPTALRHLPILNQTDNSVTKTLNKTGCLVYMKAFFSLVKNRAAIQKESLQPPFAPLVFHPSSQRTTSFTRSVSAERKTSPCFFLIGIKKKKKETVVVGGGRRLILSKCWTQNQWRFDRSRCSQLDKC